MSDKNPILYLPYYDLHTMKVAAGGIIGFFVFAFVAMMAGVGIEEGGKDPSGFYSLSIVLGAVGVFLILNKSGALGSFKINF